MRIVVAMSGGVDSSVAAALLAEQGHDVIGLSMQLYDQSEGQTSFGSCCSIEDLHDARRVAAASSTLTGSGPLPTLPAPFHLPLGGRA